ncbi:hypothetical protein SAMN05216359_105208 [Roseateles sp. YR242]|uniref:hypothetical protein n=1 Tax=Roseateles sp. YR242 TaxID=1855305 RepID=UPI0008B34E56|nr:hypothetical protein [Roseateles sp. YR242]SEL10736.1 hypothetical protein SAMN05216359_105208 [Roseateles sp. YR242]
MTPSLLAPGTPMDRRVEVDHWHAARRQGLASLERLAAEIRQSNDPEAASALADLRPMIRLLSIEAADLRAMLTLEHHWQTEPAWLDLQHQAPDILAPMQTAMEALRQALARG